MAIVILSTNPLIQRIQGKKTKELFGFLDEGMKWIVKEALMQRLFDAGSSARFQQRVHHGRGRTADELRQHLIASKEVTPHPVIGHYSPLAECVIQIFCEYTDERDRLIERETDESLVNYLSDLDKVQLIVRIVEEAVDEYLLEELTQHFPDEIPRLVSDEYRWLSNDLVIYVEEPQHDRLPVPRTR